VADRLTWAVARRLAESLTTIDGCPRYDGAIDALAQDLTRWCTGYIAPDGSRWPAEAQARWVVDEARRLWEKWAGSRALYAIFEARFLGAPAAQAGSEERRAGPECPKCSGTGVFVVLRGIYEFSGTCPECHGERTRAALPCSRCDGKGTILDVSGNRQPCPECGADLQAGPRVFGELAAEVLEHITMRKPPASTPEERLEYQDNHEFALEQQARRVAIEENERIALDPMRPANERERAAEMARALRGKEAKERKTKQPKSTVPEWLRKI
jgi:hypothetical protein